MRRIMLFMLAAILLPGLPGGFVGAQEKDHPLINRYPESKLVKKDANEFERYQLVTGLDEKFNPRGKVLEGRLTRISSRRVALVAQ